MSDTPQQTALQVASPKIVNVLIISLLFIVTVFLGYLVWQMRLQQSMQATLHARVYEFDERFSQTLRDYDQTIGVLSEQTAVNTDAAKALHEQLSRMTEFTQDDWLLSESAYLSYLAQVHLNTLRDLPTAQLQLKMAQERLDAVTNPNMLSLKEALSRSRMALEQVQLVDWEGLWLSVGELIYAVNTMPLDVPDAKTEVPGSTHEDNAPASWKSNFKAAWFEVKDLVRVRHMPEQIVTLVTLQDQAQFRHGLSLLLEEARWAIIQKNDAVYQAALGLFKQRLETYYLQTDESVIAAKIQLNSLMAESLAPALPDLTPLNRQFEKMQQS